MGKQFGVGKGAVENRVGGEGRRRRQSDGKVCACMSKSKGDERCVDATRSLWRG